MKAPLGVLWFGAAEILEDIVSTELSRHPDADTLCLNLDSIGRLDVTAAMTLRAAVDDARRAGMVVKIVGVQDRDRRLVDGIVLGTDPRP